MNPRDTFDSSLTNYDSKWVGPSTPGCQTHPVVGPIGQVFPPLTSQCLGAGESVWCSWRRLWRNWHWKAIWWWHPIASLLRACGWHTFTVYPLYHWHLLLLHVQVAAPSRAGVWRVSTLRHLLEVGGQWDKWQPLSWQLCLEPQLIFSHSFLFTSVTKDPMW